MERFAREQAPERAERTDTLVWGKNAVTELLKSGGAVDTVYLTDTMPQAVAGYYTALAKESGAVVKRVPGNKLQKMCGTPDHQGVAARAAEVEYAALDDLFRAAEARGEQPFLVLCDGVEDPHNLGAIVRSAYLCGAHGVVIPKRGGVGVTGTVMKASAGAAARLPIARVSNLAQAIRTIKEHNIFVYCADLGGARCKTDLSGPVALVLGSEGGGPGALTRKLCDAAVTLEMAPPGARLQPALTATTSALRRASCAMRCGTAVCVGTASMSCAAALQKVNSTWPRRAGQESRPFTKEESTCQANVPMIRLTGSWKN